MHLTRGLEPKIDPPKRMKIQQQICDTYAEGIGALDLSVAIIAVTRIVRDKLMTVSEVAVM